MSYRQINDNEFIRGKVPMTKSEVRTLSILKMNPEKNDVIWDIGAGTGSISLEIAVNYPGTKIYAIEKNPEGVSLIRDNCQKFGAENIDIIEGSAPEVFSAIPRPSKVIIGGSGGNLEEILELLWNYPELKNIVVNAVTLNTAYKTIEFFNKKEIYFEAFQMSISNIEMISNYQMFKAQNPIFIISAKKQEER